MATGGGASRGYNTIKGYRYDQLDKESSSADVKEDIFKRKKKKRNGKRLQKGQKLLQYKSDSSPVPKSTTTEDSPGGHTTTDQELQTVSDVNQNTPTSEDENGSDQSESDSDSGSDEYHREYQPQEKVFKCCLPFSRKNITRNCRICLLLGLSIALLFLFLFIAFLAVLIAYPELTDKTQNKTTTITIPPLSVVEVDLDKYNISTLKEHKLNISLVRNVKTEGYTGDVEVTICRHVTTCNTKPLSLHIKEENKSLLRQWTKKTNPTGNITIEEGYISWRWGNLTDNLPIYDCSTGNQWSNSSDIDVASLIKLPDQEDDLILISFCTLAEASVNIKVNITECLPSPTTPFQPLHIDNDNDNDDDDAVTLTFDDIFSEIFEHSKLYVKTIYLNSINDNYQGINLEIQPLPNKEMLIFVVVGMFLALLAIIIMIIICLCCCCKGKGCLCIKCECYKKQ